MIQLKLKEKMGELPTSVFDLFDNEKIVGLVQIRHRVSAGIGVPKECASHIYYEIEEKYRNKGYGKEALRLALDYANNLGIKTVVVTCDENNLASKKIIETNGGLYTQSCLCKDGNKLLRYEFNI